MEFTKAHELSQRLLGNARAVNSDVECDCLEDLNFADLEQIIRDATELLKAVKGQPA